MHQQPRNILYIDDDPGTRRLVERLLGRRGHTITSAANGPEGIELAKEGGFDILLVGQNETAGTTPPVSNALMVGANSTATSIKDLAGHRLAVPVWMAGTVLFTALGGVVFCLLRLLSGSVFAAMGLHWATNGLGSLVQIFARKPRPRSGDAVPESG